MSMFYSNHTKEIVTTNITTDIPKLELPILPHYHPNSALGTREGYYPNISQSQLLAVEKLKQKLLQDDGIDITLNKHIINNKSNSNDTHDAYHDEEEHWFFHLLRFLRARRFHVENAYILFINDYKWRHCTTDDNGDEKEAMHTLKHHSAQEVLNCDILKMYSYFPTWLQGYDKQGRPVSYRQFGYFEIWNVLKLIDMKILIKFHSWECEQAIRLMKQNSKTLNCNIETFTIVIDAEKWSLRLATSEAYTFIHNMIQADSNYYPERLGTLIIINAPSALSIAWQVIRPFMDDVTRSKAQIFSGRAQWQPALEELIDREFIPRQYGGLAPDLSSQEAIDSLNPPLSKSQLKMNAEQKQQDQQELKHLEAEEEERKKTQELLHQHNSTSHVTSNTTLAQSSSPSSLSTTLTTAPINSEDSDATATVTDNTTTATTTTSNHAGTSTSTHDTTGTATTTSDTTDTTSTNGATGAVNEQELLIESTMKIQSLKLSPLTTTTTPSSTAQESVGSESPTKLRRLID